MIYLLLFVEFFKIGLFTFGGGYAMIPLIKDAVLTHGWLSEEAFYDFIGVCESTPGPIAVNMATYIGSVNGGILGSVAATLGVILPAFIIMVLICSILAHVVDNKAVKYILKGFNGIVVGLILGTAISMLVSIIGLDDYDVIFDWVPFVMFCIVTAIYFICKYGLKKKLNAVSIILISAFIGLGLCLIVY